jgi:hypothetical protein
MKTSSCVKHLRIHFLGGLALVGALATATPVWAAATTSTSTTPYASVPQYSPGVGDVVRMINAKVDLEVVKAFIRSSPIPYNPSATEIIALEQSGVTDDIIKAMLERGGELRARAMAAAQQNLGATPAMPSYNPNATPPTYPSYPGYDYGTTAGSYPDYSYDNPSYVYDAGYPYYGYYGYPWVGVGWGGYWGWPWYGGYYGRYYHGYGFNHGFNHFGAHGFVSTGRGGVVGHASIGGSRAGFGGGVRAGGGFGGGHGGGGHR